ncbi:MAG: LysE family translocator [Acidobacteria bacterium]|nr:LysE family translocator [Acidobacteriota bacterium]
MLFFPPARELIVFVSAATLLLVIPGPAVLYILARSMDQGRTAGLASAAGTAVGTLVHVAAATLGLSALLISSALAYSAVKYAGACYLFYLGIKKFRERPGKHSNDHACDHPIPVGKVFGQGVVVNILNPKTAIFFFAFLPQFVSPTRGHVSVQFLALGMTFAVMGYISDSMWALSAGSAAHWLRRKKRFVNNERYVAGTVYMGLGLATAVGANRHK